MDVKCPKCKGIGGWRERVPNEKPCWAYTEDDPPPEYRWIRCYACRCKGWISRVAYACYVASGGRISVLCDASDLTQTTNDGEPNGR